MKTIIKIEKLNEDNYLIKKTKAFNDLCNTTDAIYQRFILDWEDVTKENYIEKEEFINLLVIVKSENENATLNKKEIKLLSDWIDGICNYIIERNTTNLKNKDLNLYFKIASDFNKNVNSLLIISEKV